MNPTTIAAGMYHFQPLAKYTDKANDPGLPAAVNSPSEPAHSAVATVPSCLYALPKCLPFSKVYPSVQMLVQKIQYLR